jgi:hypothetical protein
VSTTAEIRKQLDDQLLEAFSAEYDFAVETWKMLEGKAQASVTISGIFFAAAFAYARESGAPTPLPRALLIVTVIALLFSVGSAVLSLALAQVSTPPLGRFNESIVFDLRRLPEGELSDEHIERFVAERIRQWREAIRTVDESNQRKAAHVRRSHLFLAIAMISAACVTILRFC